MCEGLAFSEIINYIKSKTLSLEGNCVFKMADLRSMYHERLAQLLGVEKSKVRLEKSTKLREKILSYLPDFKYEKSGKGYIILLASASILHNLENEDHDEEAICFQSYAKKLRASIAATSYTFTGT